MLLRLQTPLALAGALLLFHAFSQAPPPLDGALSWAALALVAFALYQSWKVQAARPSGPGLGTTPVDSERLRAQLDDAHAQLELETRTRRAAEQALRTADERYSLAVRGASDGLWEWDLVGGKAYFSPLWKSLLGFEDDEIGGNIDEWRSRIHPEDKARVLQEMDDHLAGHTSRFENEHRLLHKDQSWHWVQARGSAIRHANGKAYRMVGLHSDITARRAAEQMLLEVAEALASARGEACFQLIAQNFAKVMGVREAFVCEPCDQPPTKARMLAWWCEGRFLPNVEYELEGTPCKNPQVEGRTCYCSKGLEEMWPLEKPFDRTAYLGIPIRDSAGVVIGHIACTDNKPMPERTPHLAIFRLFAERASVELERRMLSNANVL